MNSVWHEWWKARDVSSLSRGSKVEVAIHNIPCVVHWKLKRSTPSTDFQFSLFKAKIPESSCALQEFCFPSTYITGSWRCWSRTGSPSLTVAWRLHPQVASQPMATPDIKFRRVPWIPCVSALDIVDEFPIEDWISLLRASIFLWWGGHWGCYLAP